MNKILLTKGLTFDDVNIVPGISDIKTRRTIDITTRFTKHFNIRKPFVSSPMDTVTGLTMMINLFELGGVGILHRFVDLKERVGIIKEYVKYLKNNVANNQINNIPVAASIGIGSGWLEDFTSLVKAGANVILIDVANGGNTRVVNVIEKIINTKKKLFKNKVIDIIAGNVATWEAANILYQAGVDAIRVGIGNGAACTTRIKTGIGVPQITALLEVAEHINSEIPIIADGGIRYPGDVAKAIAAGAETVMLGSLLAGTKESPGPVYRKGLFPNESLYKEYRGSASYETKLVNNQSTENVEGIATTIPYKGKVSRIITELEEGLKSSMSYVGTNSIKEFMDKATFIQVTSAAQLEAKPHIIF